MRPVEIQKGIRLGFDEMVVGASAMETADLEKFQREVSHLLAKRRAGGISKRETELLLKINQDFPERFWKEYSQLIEQRRAGKLTPAEHERLIEMSDRLENANVERIKRLVELAALKNMDLDDLMQQLGIQPKSQD